MTDKYWGQFSMEELMSLHCLDTGNVGQVLISNKKGKYRWVDVELDEDNVEEKLKQVKSCSKCFGNGCNECLMLSY